MSQQLTYPPTNSPCFRSLKDGFEIMLKRGESQKRESDGLLLADMRYWSDDLHQGCFDVCLNVCLWAEYPKTLRRDLHQIWWVVYGPSKKWSTLNANQPIRDLADHHKVHNFATKPTQRMILKALSRAGSWSLLTDLPKPTSYFLENLFRSIIEN